MSHRYGHGRSGQRRGCSPTEITRCLTAKAAAWSRDRTPSLVRMLCTCVRTVLALTESVRALPPGGVDGVITSTDHADHVPAHATKGRKDGIGEQGVVVDHQDPHRASSPARGSSKWNTEPLRDEPSQILPPWASITRRAMNRPRPFPVRTSCAADPRMNGSKIESCSDEGTPGPWSRTVTVAPPS